MVEHGLFKPGVEGSIPSALTNGNDAGVSIVKLRKRLLLHLCNGTRGVDFKGGSEVFYGRRSLVAGAVEFGAKWRTRSEAWRLKRNIHG